MQVYDVSANDTVLHKPFVTGSYADAPFARKEQKFNGHAATMGCGYCPINGQPGERGGMYFYGYAERTQFGFCTPGAPKQEAYAGSQALSEEQMHLRAQLAAAGGNPSQLGAHGPSTFIQKLPYARYSTLWLLPVCHSLLLGLVKDFWNLLLCKKQQGQPYPWYAIRPEHRRLLQKRGPGITITNDFTRPYRCIVTKRGHYTMDDWRKFTTVFSVFVLLDSEEVG